MNTKLKKNVINNFSKKKINITTLIVIGIFIRNKKIMFSYNRSFQHIYHKRKL